MRRVGLGFAVAAALMLSACGTTSMISIPLPGGASVPIAVPTSVTNPVSSATVDRRYVVAGAVTFDAVEQLATEYLKRPKCPQAVLCRDPKVSKPLIAAMRKGIIIRRQMVSFARQHPDQLGDQGLQDALNQTVNTIRSLIGA